MLARSIGPLPLHVLVDGDGPPVLLLHGHGGTGETWDLQVEALAPRFRVVRFDLRGHGRSGKPRGPYTMTQLAGDAAEVIREVGGGAPAHVAGHSLGGAVALQLALDEPALVRSLVVINSQACLRPRTVFEKLFFPMVRWAPRILGWRLQARSIAAGYLPGEHLAERRARLVELWTRNDLEGYAASAEATRTFDVTSRLGEIRVPTLVVASDQDILPHAHKVELANGIAGARLLVIERSRHIVVWDQPEALCRALLEFFAEVDAAPAARRP